MADIFISYSKTERAVTETLARDLEGAGYSVWWDTGLVPGDVFKDVIIERISGAKAAVVIWTPGSVRSEWVYSEARRAKEQGKLVPLRTPDVALSDIPPPFDAMHTELIDNRLAIVAAVARLGAMPGLAAPESRPIDRAASARASVEDVIAQRLRLSRLVAEEEHWALIKTSGDVEAFRRFLADYPDGAYRSAAMARLSQIAPGGRSRSQRGRRFPGLALGLAAALAGAMALGWLWRDGLPTRLAALGRAPSAVAGSDAPIHDCDRLAASPNDRSAKTAGVAFERLRPEAIAACEAAVDAHPDVVRFWVQLGRSYAKAKRYTEARPFYEKAARAGDGGGMASMGWIYLNGFGVAQDLAAAREWFERAAAAGVVRGLSGLAHLYAEGKGVIQDYRRAHEQFEQAAREGDGAAMNGLATLYGSGLGVARDLAKAREWYEKALVRGDTDGLAQGNFAWFLATEGDSVADHARAARLLLESGRLGSDAYLKAFRGQMGEWPAPVRTELKRELVRLGHLKGKADDKWDDAARAAIERYLKAETK